MGLSFLVSKRRRDDESDALAGESGGEILLDGELLATSRWIWVSLAKMLSEIEVFFLQKLTLEYK